MQVVKLGSVYRLRKGSLLTKEKWKEGHLSLVKDELCENPHEAYVLLVYSNDVVASPKYRIPLAMIASQLKVGESVTVPLSSNSSPSSSSSSSSSTNTIRRRMSYFNINNKQQNVPSLPRKNSSILFENSTSSTASVGFQHHQMDAAAPKGRGKWSRRSTLSGDGSLSSNNSSSSIIFAETPPQPYLIQNSHLITTTFPTQQQQKGSETAAAMIPTNHLPTTTINPQQLLSFPQIRMDYQSTAGFLKSAPPTSSSQFNSKSTLTRPFSASTAGLEMIYLLIPDPAEFAEWKRLLAEKLDELGISPPPPLPHHHPTSNSSNNSSVSKNGDDERMTTSATEEESDNNSDPTTSSPWESYWMDSSLDESS